MSEKPKMSRIVGLGLGTLAAVVWLAIWGNISASLFLEQAMAILTAFWGFGFFVLFILIMADEKSNDSVTWVTIGYFFAGLLAPFCVLVMAIEKIRLGRKYRR